jgi:Na+-translocating ferredoxin:NAD+ oxidoreductase RnfD subunit
MPTAWAGMPTLRDPRVAIAAILLAYVILGLTVLGFNRSPLQVVQTVATAVLLDMALHAIFRRGSPPLVPLSASITGLGLSILVNYAHGPWFASLPVLFAIGSKYLFTFRGRHVYNPALFGVVASLVLGQGYLSESPAYQWGGSFAALAFVATLGSMLFLLPVRRTVLILAFLAFYFIALAVRAWFLRHHMPMETWFMGALTSPAFFLFTFFMLTDPATSPDSRRGQVGVAAAIVAVDFVLHLKLALSTLFFAAFIVATARLVYFHVVALIAVRGEGRAAISGRLRVGAKRLTALAAVAGSVILGLPRLTGAESAEDPGFFLQEVGASASGIVARPGNVLDLVDPRVQHVGKWVLSVGDAVAVADVDNDGLQDVFFTFPMKVAEDRAALYRNRGGFVFERIPLPALASLVNDPRGEGLPSGAIFFDMDNDGDQDLLVLVGYGRPRLLKNLLMEAGRLVFEDVSDRHDLPPHLVSLAANVLDVDRDGRLDLVIASAMRPYLGGYATPRAFSVFDLPAPEYAGDRRMFDFMHRSWSDARNGGGVHLLMQFEGRYIDRTVLLGELDARWTLAIGAGDLDGDGWTDLYFANDFGPDQLLLSRRGTGFDLVRGKMVGQIGRDTYKGMNASLGDFDGNGHLDIYVSNVHERLQAEGSLLWMNSGRGRVDRWRDEAMARNALNEHRFGWGAAVGDVDRDGRLDILQANGMVDDAPDPMYSGCPDYWYWNDKIALTHPDVHGHADRWADLRGRCIFPSERNRVYLNRGRYFVDVAPRVGWERPGTARAVALVDLDNDGDLDAIVTRQFSSPSIYRNEAIDKVWVGLMLEGNGTTCNRDAVGTRVLVEQAGSPPQVRELHAVNGFSAQSDRRMLFGFGTRVGEIRASVDWCGSGRTEQVTFASGQYHRLVQSR